MTNTAHKPIKVYTNCNVESFLFVVIAIKACYPVAVVSGAIIQAC